MTYALRPFEKAHEPFLNDLFQMAKADENMRIGYPQCEDVHEYATEVHGYGNIISQCTFLITCEGSLVGAMGLLHAPDEDEGMLWGPMLKKEHQQAAVVAQCLNSLLTQMAEKVCHYQACIAAENIFLLDCFKASLWQFKKTYTQMACHLAATAIDNSIAYAVRPLSGMPLTMSQVIGLFQESFHWEDSASVIKDLLNNSSYQFLFYAQEGIVAGAVCFSLIQEDAFARIEYLAVKEDFRRMGIGRALLLSAMEQIAGNDAIKTIHLAVDEGLDAVHLYEAAGFTPQIVSHVFTLKL